MKNRMHRHIFWFFAASILLFGSPRPVAARSVAAYSWEQSSCVAGCTPSRQVAYIAADGDIHELYNIAGTGWADADLTAITGAPQPSAGSPLAGFSWEIATSKSVAYIATDGHIHELYVDSVDQAWYDADLTALAGVRVDPLTSLAGYSFESNASKQIAYIGADGHLHELYVFWNGDGWHDVDLTWFTGSTPPVIGSQLVGVASDPLRLKAIAYPDFLGKLHILLVYIGGQWQESLFSPYYVGFGFGPLLAGYSWRSDVRSEVYCDGINLSSNHLEEVTFDHDGIDNLTHDTGSRPGSGSPLAGYGNSRTGLIRSRQIDYITADGDIHELTLDASWTDVDLTLRTGAPPPDGTVLLGYSSEVAGPSKQVVYTTADGDIHELYWAPGGAWIHTDLTISAGAPPAM